MSQVAVVTGTARGIGLELCRHLLRRDATVVACPRRGGSPGLAELAASHPDRFHEIPTDVGDEASVAETGRRIADTVDHVDVLINNAGVYPSKGGGIEGLDTGDLALAFEVNAVGPLRMTRALLPLLRKGTGRRVANVTSLMGSMTDNTSGGSYAYRMSKAALNMATVNLAHELGREGFVVVTIHPGWVQTDMGGMGAPLSISPATEDVLRAALDTPPDQNGTFRGPGGRELPW
jgi:NAD(P)-dependent dehydrogenase (short-subunit alcohol dehydrogenase family)